MPLEAIRLDAEDVHKRAASIMQILAENGYPGDPLTFASVVYIMVCNWYTHNLGPEQMGQNMGTLLHIAMTMLEQTLESGDTRLIALDVHKPS